MPGSSTPSPLHEEARRVLGGRFGVDRDAIDGLTFVDRRDEIWACRSHPPEGIASERPSGLRAFRRQADGLKPTSTFLIALGDRITASRAALAPGDAVVLPARPAVASAAVFRSLRIELARSSDPNQLLASLPAAEPGKGSSAVRLLPYSNLDGKVVFSLIIPEFFAAEPDAAAALRGLPEHARSNARIVRGAAPQTTFYATL